MNLLELDRITKSFTTAAEPVTAISDASLTVGKGEFVSLIGPSGCGKSTILDIVAGLTLPDEGVVSINGQVITGQKGLVGYMPQKDVLFPWRTILDNVIVGLEVQGMRKAEAREQAIQLLPLFGLEKFASSYPDSLSGGMKQRAAFLRTFLAKKELMLLDEPFGKLDALTRMEMQQWLLSIWQTYQHTVLLVTHDIDEAILLSDRIYFLSHRPGRIIAEVEVSLPRPRLRDSRLTLDPTFIAIKRQLLELLGAGDQTS
ncbi:ABC transporter ATP-binding protein [Brevibacillus sp. SYSU BS000544]|uniref:ABC transporter ATP-binding protein n=1 Tax=Brevibacillus sp. SYSU BS000544 TaxID=3416443 RepID=UPI003CE52707